MAEIKQPRTIKCYRCEATETEKIFGSGFMGWGRLTEIFVEGEVEEVIGGNPPIVKKYKTKFNPELCPLCIKELCYWIEEKIKR